MISLVRLGSIIREPSDSLSDQVLHSGIWATALNVSGRGLQFVQLVVLARLLVPADFGVFGLAVLTLGMVRRMSKVGFDAALIQREQEDVTKYLDTTWVVKISRGIGVFVLVLLGAPLIAGFFDVPRLRTIVSVLALGPVLAGMKNPAIVYFRKDLRFRKLFVYRTSGMVANLVVSVALALLWRNVWALVFGLLAADVAQIVASYLIHQYRPGMNYDPRFARELFGFGRWILATDLVVWLATAGDDAFVGWYLTASALGLYRIAFRFSNSPATEITHVISSVAFPAYSKLQNDDDALQSGFSRTVTVTALATIPASVGIFLIASPFTYVVLGEKWMPMVPVLKLLVLAGLLRSFQATGGALFRGVGVPVWDFRMNVVSAAAIALTVWPLSARWGILGAAGSVTLGIGASMPVWLYKTREITGLDAIDYAEFPAIPLLSSLLMAAPVWLIVDYDAVRIALSVLAGVCVYGTAVYALYRLRGRNVFHLIGLQ